LLHPPVSGQTREIADSIEPASDYTKTLSAKLLFSETCGHAHADYEPVKPCPSKLRYYRCDSLHEYLDKHKNVPAELNDALTKISTFEGCLQKRAVHGNVLNIEALRNVLDTSKALVNYLAEHRKKEHRQKDKSGNQSFLTALLQLRLENIATQLSYTDYKWHSEEMSRFAQRIWDLSTAKMRN
jgi:hypothetical protein